MMVPTNWKEEVWWKQNQPYATKAYLYLSTYCEGGGFVDDEKAEGGEADLVSLEAREEHVQLGHRGAVHGVQIDPVQALLQALHLHKKPSNFLSRCYVNTLTQCRFFPLNPNKLHQVLSKYISELWIKHAE